MKIAKFDTYQIKWRYSIITFRLWPFNHFQVVGSGQYASSSVLCCHSHQSRRWKWSKCIISWQAYSTLSESTIFETSVLTAVLLCLCPPPLLLLYYYAHPPLLAAVLLCLPPPPPPLNTVSSNSEVILFHNLQAGAVFNSALGSFLVSALYSSLMVDSRMMTMAKLYLYRSLSSGNLLHTDVVASLCEYR